MHAQAAQRDYGTLDVLKYYGKWPFRRILGIQEPASVLASLACAVAHVWGLRRFYVLVSDIRLELAEASASIPATVGHVVVLWTGSDI